MSFIERLSIVSFTQSVLQRFFCTIVPQEKSAKYWPENPNNTVTAGDCLTVTLSSSTPYAEYHIRNFLLKHVRPNWTFLCS